MEEALCCIATGQYRLHICLYLNNYEYEETFVFARESGKLLKANSDRCHRRVVLLFIIYHVMA